MEKVCVVLQMKYAYIILIYGSTVPKKITSTVSVNCLFVSRTLHDIHSLILGMVDQDCKNKKNTGSSNCGNR